MITIGIITAKRKHSTINRTISSLRSIGIDSKIYIFSEPHELNITDKNVDIKMNKETLGCFKNYNNALTFMSEIDGYIGVFSDDFIFSSQTLNRMRYSDGYYAFYTPKGMSLNNDLSEGWNEVNKGWEGSYGGNYVMHSSVAKKIINHDFYINHLNNYEKNQQIDHCIPEVCFQLGIQQYYHRPSLSNHVGYKSTIGHKHTSWEDGLDFRM